MVFLFPWLADLLQIVTAKQKEETEAVFSIGAWTSRGTGVNPGFGSGSGKHMVAPEFVVLASKL